MVPRTNLLLSTVLVACSLDTFGISDDGMESSATNVPGTSTSSGTDPTTTGTTSAQTGTTDSSGAPETTEPTTDGTTAPSLCDNGILDPNEACDGVDLDDHTCISQGFDGGTLSCDPTCQFDSGECYTKFDCGDGTGIDPGLKCDANPDCANAKDEEGCTCGDGIVGGDELCDAGDCEGGDGGMCQEGQCTLSNLPCNVPKATEHTRIQACHDDCSSRPTWCGDNILQDEYEQCDLGNCLCNPATKSCHGDPEVRCSTNDDCLNVADTCDTATGTCLVSGEKCNTQQSPVGEDPWCSFDACNIGGSLWPGTPRGTPAHRATSTLLPAERQTSLVSE